MARFLGYPSGSEVSVPARPHPEGHPPGLFGFPDKAGHGSKALSVTAQVIPAGLDTHHDPQRWRQTWYDGFCQSHPGFKYRTLMRWAVEHCE